MTTVATAHATSTAAPGAFFERWADVATWPGWSLDTLWVRLDGPFAAGSTGRLKPKGGPAVRFRIERLVPDREFVDVSLLVGARLTFDHRIDRRSDGGSTIDITVSLTGPLRRFWTLVLGKGLAASVGPDLDRLVAAAERLGTTAS